MNLAIKTITEAVVLIGASYKPRNWGGINYKLADFKIWAIANRETAQHEPNYKSKNYLARTKPYTQQQLGSMN